MQILQTEKQIQCISDNNSIIVDKLELNYPNYKAIIPTNFAFEVEINRKSLIEEVKKAAIYANQASNKVELLFSENCVQILASDIDFSIDSKSYIGGCKCLVNGNIVFNSKLLLHILNISTSETIILKMNDNSKAIVIENTLLMPMNLDNSINLTAIEKQPKIIELDKCEPMPLLAYNNGKINRKNIIKHAHELYNWLNFESWSDCLKLAWSMARKQKTKITKTKEVKHEYEFIEL